MHHDPQEPRAEVPRVMAPAQSAVRPNERVLNRILGLLALSELPPRETQAGGVVSFHQRIERGRVTAPNALDQFVVGGHRRVGLHGVARGSHGWGRGVRSEARDSNVKGRDSGAGGGLMEFLWPVALTNDDG